MKHYNNIIFDLDGTLTDSGEGVMGSVVYAFEKLGYPVPSPAQLRACMGPPLTESFPRYGIPEDRVDEAVLLYRENYIKNGANMLNYPYPGIAEMLSRLRESGKKLYVATSKPEDQARDVLSRFSLDKYFSFIAGATYDRSRESKSAVIRFLIDHIGGTDPALMVGDRKYDVIGAAEFGIETVGILWGYGSVEELTEAGAIALARTPEKLADMLV